MKTKSMLLILFLVSFIPLPAKAGGIPVFDAANLQQTTLSAIEAVNQTLKQIEQYALQLQQYEDMIKNSVAPAAYVWDQAQRTMNKVIALQNQIEFYMEQGGDVDNYLRKFGNLSMLCTRWKTSRRPCVRMRPIWKRSRPTPRAPRVAWRPSSTQISWPATRPTSCFNLGAF